MKQLNVFFLLLVTCLFMLSCAEDMKEEDVPVCETTRYSADIFSDATKTTIKFAENLDQEGELVELYMDIFEPAGDDLEARPAIVWAFGGAFISGRRQDIEEIALAYVRKGFVCATFDYRLIKFNGSIPDSIQAGDIAVKASQDMRAAIRELKKDAASSNRFRVDPGLIFAGGVSAGAITALQTAIFDESDMNDDSQIKSLVVANGGLKGNSGDALNQSFDESVAGVINLSGAVLKLEFFDPSDPPVISYHGDADVVVKYGYDYAEVLFNRIIRLYGSGAFHPYLDQIGIKNNLYTVPGGGHVDIYTDSAFSNDRETFTSLSADFIREEFCL